jgi:hypothetical protein
MFLWTPVRTKRALQTSPQINYANSQKCHTHKCARGGFGDNVSVDLERIRIRPRTLDAVDIAIFADVGHRRAVADGPPK